MQKTNLKQGLFKFSINYSPALQGKASLKSDTYLIITSWLHGYIRQLTDDESDGEDAVEVLHSDLNDEEEVEDEYFEEADCTNTPLKLISPSETRWLVIADCIERILGQYDALKAHFDIAYQREKCYEAGTLKNMFEDERNRLYLTFLYPPLSELRRITKIFQSKSVNSIKIFEDFQ